MVERRYTPADVNRLIPELEQIVQSLGTLETDMQQKQWQLRQARVETMRRGVTVDDQTFMQQEAEIDFMRILAHQQFERVQELGGEMKGGFLVDFLGSIDGEDVLLCWKPGELEVRWYHGVHEGMGGRKPIPAELLEDGEQGDGTGSVETEER